MTEMPTPAADPRILLVDDEDPVREMLAKLLVRAYPHGVIHATPDAASALRLCEENAYDIVVSDQRMPGQDGVSFLRDVRARAPRAMRILLTAYPEERIALRGINEARLERFLTKPMAAQEFLAAIDEAWQAMRREDLKTAALARGLTTLKRELDEERERKRPRAR